MASRYCGKAGAEVRVFRFRTGGEPHSLPAMAKSETSSTTDDKASAARARNLELAIQQIAKDYGDEAIRRLSAAGFEKFRPSSSPSTPEMKDKVLGTNPPANQTSAITNEIIVVLGAGPETRPVPDVAGQTIDSATQILNTAGFTKVVPVNVDSPQPQGQLVGTNPAAGETVPVDTVIQLQVSRGNQFIMPDVRGMFWVDAEPRLRALGWTGVLDRGADVQNSGQRPNAVVTQNPPPGAGVNFDSRITLSFAS